MADIRAFKGWRYDGKKVGKLEKVLAPPYDVISKKDQAAYHRKHPANVIRLILGQDKKGDGAAVNKYTRAKGFLREWTQKGILRQDERPAVYVYVQDYREDGQSKRRVGFIGAMKLDERSVLRHENTLATPKKDRMALLKEVRTNLSPIFGLIEDKKALTGHLLRRALRQAPAIDVTLDGVRHRVYVEQDASVLSKLTEAMKRLPVFIADGHHRFEVATQFKAWMRSQCPSDTDAPWNYVMMYFSDCLHNPFKIFPTHRLLKVKTSDVLRALSAKGSVRKAAGLKALLSRLSRYRQDVKGGGYDFGGYTRKDGFFTFSLSRAETAKIGKNPVDKLDVAVLHQSVIAPIFGVRRIEKSEAIDFTRDANEAVQRVKSGEFDLALFLRPTSLKEMLDVSKRGLKMPQKSTYFYPKLLSGLVFHRFEA